MEVSAWFIAVFILSWIAGPLTQFLQLIAPKLHHRLGLMEAHAFKPEFNWYLLDERAIALADMTYLVAGGAFILMALMDNKTGLIFGIYTCSCYVFIGVLATARFILLAKHELVPTPKAQLVVFMSYMGAFVLFGLFGLFYLWGLAQA